MGSVLQVDAGVLVILRDVSGRTATGLVCLAAVLILVGTGTLLAQGSAPIAAIGDSRASAPGIEPPPPSPPAVMNRDESGRMTLRAVRIERPPAIDGVLGEEIYDQVPAINGFTQQEPEEGRPSSEQTEVWLLFDDRHVYVSARLWQDPSSIVGTEMRRDNQNLTRNDNFAVIFDTFRDRRNGFMFYMSAAGGLFDGLVTEESQNNREWNTVWDGRTARFDGGWTVEMAIPFRSLRYLPGRDQVWGVNFRRIIIGKNELATLAPVPASYGNPGVLRVSLAATLVGVQAPPTGTGLEIKPYALSSLTTNRAADPPTSNDLSGDAGFDVKYSLTRGLTLDFTYNTDFAQVEDDEQQVNLTRFSQFFPERREFFLEGQGLYAFGGARTAGRIVLNQEIPILFFSRSIGLNEGQPVTIPAGVRLGGRAGRYSLGAINIQTGDDDRTGARSTNFTVLRVKRDILSRSAIGLLATNRSVSLTAPGSNRVLGVDGSFPLHRELTIDTYYAMSRTPGLSGRNASYRVDFNYPADRYGVQVEHMTVEPNFNPEVGFVRRSDFRRNFALLRFSPRPVGNPLIRKLTFQGSFDHIANTAGRVDLRESKARFQSDFHSGDLASLEYTRTFEFIPEAFELGEGVTVPVGEYEFDDVALSLTLAPQRVVSGVVRARRGTFYSGTRTDASYTGRITMGSRVTLEPNVSVNWIDLREGSFTNRLFSTRVSVTFTPRMAIGTLAQYNSRDDSLAVNVRYTWEYRPGSDLFVVYSEGRDTSVPGRRELENRTFTIKLTRLLRF
jgi:hypothetical protein